MAATATKTITAADLHKLGWYIVIPEAIKPRARKIRFNDDDRIVAGPFTSAAAMELCLSWQDDGYPCFGRWLGEDLPGREG